MAYFQYYCDVTKSREMCTVFVLWYTLDPETIEYI